ncbi:ABC transporter ATP-binding protein [Galbitalea sp. SE-J8]|uniref:dipeptide ABC transporter ATP-binding protein n=1 Tax=Galbitalea sp. SE-J8 TaxID=3054952 RepID=UPI00259CE645|nr:ABC transporter ATP-binding protein [Galbitalea sp. SE-J8]MDM4763894.1 ABC transporter ATP-binding protein [Galbitalea sp. SE-J8]
MTEIETRDVLAVNALSVAFADRDAPTAPPRTVVDGVDFHLGHGRVLALVGESGSGKSVTAMSVLGLLPANARVEGSIRLEGRELVGADAATVRAVRGGRIGTIFQEPMSAFNPVLTLGAQIAEAIVTHHPRLRRREVRARSLELLESVGIAEPLRIARSHPHELSGGQLQRSMIAMAISSDPIALIADEPTTALDVTVQAGILDLIRSLRDDRGTAVLLITHDMGVVADLADDVVVMRSGHVEERESSPALFAAPQAGYTRELLRAVPRLGETAARLRSSEPLPAELSAAAEVRAARIEYGGGWGRPAVVAVESATFAIRPGRTLGLVGESGSGKSTLGRAFAGLVPVRSGEVLVGGIDLARASRRELRELRSAIGYVFQDPASSLDPRWTVGDAIAEPLRLGSDKTPRERRARVLELLDAVRLSESHLERFPHELSGGQRQRVAIARAIALHPSLLIADEPTSALDVSVQARVLDLLADLQREFGFACLFVSHDLAVVQELAHEVAVMRAGRIVELGPTERVLSAPDSPYTRRLLAAAPVADPAQQAARRRAWRGLAAEADPAAGDGDAA